MQGSGAQETWCIQTERVSSSLPDNGCLGTRFRIFLARSPCTRSCFHCSTSIPNRSSLPRSIEINRCIVFNRTPIHLFTTTYFLSVHLRLHLPDAFITAFLSQHPTLDNHSLFKSNLIFFSSAPSIKSSSRNGFHSKATQSRGQGVLRRKEKGKERGKAQDQVGAG